MEDEDLYFMNMASIASASLVLCDRCKRHGCFMFGDGEHSRHFFSKSEAEKIAVELRAAELITVQEFLFLKDLLRLSELAVRELTDIERLSITEGCYPGRSQEVETQTFTVH